MSDRDPLEQVSTLALALGAVVGIVVIGIVVVGLALLGAIQ